MDGMGSTTWRLCAALLTCLACAHAQPEAPDAESAPPVGRTPAAGAAGSATGVATGIADDGPPIIIGYAHAGENGTIVDCAIVDRERESARIRGSLVPKCNATQKPGYTTVYPTGKPRSDPGELPPLVSGKATPFKTSVFKVPPTGKTVRVHAEAPCNDGNDKINVFAECLVP